MFVKGLLQRIDDSHWYTGGVAIGGFALCFPSYPDFPRSTAQAVGSNHVWLVKLNRSAPPNMWNSAPQADQSGTPSGLPGRNGFKEPVGNSWFRKIFPTPFPCQHPRDSTALSKVAPSIIVFFGIMTDSLRVFSTTNNHNNNWLVVWNIFFIFHNIWDNPSRWLIFFTGVETTNQIFYNHLLFGGHRNAGRLNPHQICFDAARDFYEGIVDNIGIMWDNSGDDDDDDDDRKDMGLSKNGVILVPGYPQYGHLLVGKRDLQPWDFGYFGGIRGYPIFSQTQLLECRFLPRSSCFFNTWSMKKIPWTLVDWPI